MSAEATDEVLMQRFCDGDSKALEVLFDRHSGPVHGFLARMVRDDALAEDLLQSTFLSVVRSADRYQRGAPVMPWLLTIAGNAARDALRRRRMHPESSTTDEEGGEAYEPSVEPAMGDPVARKHIEAAFEKLPPPQREAVLMHKVHGMSFEQIAEALDITPTAARIRAHRGYEKLRELLEGLR